MNSNKFNLEDKVVFNGSSIGVVKKIFVCLHTNIFFYLVDDGKRFRSLVAEDDMETVTIS